MNLFNKRFLTFVLIGTFNTLLDTLLFTILVIIFGNSADKIILLNILSFSTIIMCSFYMNGNFTFKDNNLTKRKFIKYYSSSSFGMMLNTVIVTFLMTAIGFGTIVSKILAACCIVFYNYAMSKRFIFENKI